jgi:hypothetical protein
LGSDFWVLGCELSLRRFANGGGATTEEHSGALN